MTNEEDKLQKVAVELRILEETANALQARGNLVNAALAELESCQRTLEGVRKEEEGASFLVPVGGGSYVKVKLESPDTVIFGVGAGVTIERTTGESIEKVGNRIVDLKKARTTLQQQLNQVVGKIEDNRSTFHKLTAILRKKEKTGDVRKTKRGT